MKLMKFFILLTCTACTSSEVTPPLSSVDNMDSAIRYFFTKVPPPSSSVESYFYEASKHNLKSDSSIINLNLNECEKEKCFIGLAGDDVDYVLDAYKSACQDYVLLSNDKSSEVIVVFFGASKVYHQVKEISDKCVSRLIYVVNNDLRWTVLNE